MSVGWLRDGRAADDDAVEGVKREREGRELSLREGRAQMCT